MLAVVLALTLSHAASKRELLECALHKTEAEVAGCVAVWEERRAAKSSSSPTKQLAPKAQLPSRQCVPQTAREADCQT